jgi:hypothetical protein
VVDYGLLRECARGDKPGGGASVKELEWGFGIRVYPSCTASGGGGEECAGDEFRSVRHRSPMDSGTRGVGALVPGWFLEGAKEGRYGANKCIIRSQQHETDRLP